MVYTAIYRDKGEFKTLVFVSKHDKNEAWRDYNDNFAGSGHELVGLCPGHAVVYFDQHISPAMD